MSWIINSNIKHSFLVFAVCIVWNIFHSHHWMRFQVGYARGTGKSSDVSDTYIHCVLLFPKKEKQNHRKKIASISLHYMFMAKSPQIFELLQWRPLLARVQQGPSLIHSVIARWPPGESSTILLNNPVQDKQRQFIICRYFKNVSRDMNLTVTLL